MSIDSFINSYKFYEFIFMREPPAPDTHISMIDMQISQEKNSHKDS